MSEVNESMVCKYIPKKKRPKPQDTVSKQSELDPIPESDSLTTQEKSSATNESLRRESNITMLNGVTKFAQLKHSNSLDNIFKPDNIMDNSLCDVSSIATSESDTKAVFDDG